ncbi:lipoyl synthase [Desulfovibrio sp. UIB00]|uniref:lipoyl synthase n=1 Tax=Desulfovibrio sp. UIB00 TaxID=2804314 RepID=UPI001F0DB74A|nr:lipoyl synthase [Desulfovibrio sp. UIB00]MCH5145836.1 lipoyl synthase [Desulfovibrio sp. UIB00]
MTQPDSSDNSGSASAPLRKPAWLRRPLASDKRFFTTSALLNEQGLSTVCKEANCPNRQECFSSGTATFLILGETCTRNCRFCNIHPGQTSAPDPTEPQRVAQAAVTLGLRHVVVTSVTRDDLADGGSAQFASVITALRQALPDSSVEVLIPDFQGNADALRTVMDAKPHIINHNVETHPALYAQVRPQADYEQSLELLRRVNDCGMTAKSGLMLGLGETDAQVLEVIKDLHTVGCSIVTIGQYLPPTSQHHKLDRYVTPEQFDEYAAYGKSLGLRHVFSGPLVRSSYHAANFA